MIWNSEPKSMLHVSSVKLRSYRCLQGPIVSFQSLANFTLLWLFRYMYSCLSFWDPRIWYANVHSFQAISEEFATQANITSYLQCALFTKDGTKDGDGLGSYLFFFGRALSCLLLRCSLVHLTSGTMFNNIYGSFVGNNASQNKQTKTS